MLALLKNDAFAHTLGQVKKLHPEIRRLMGSCSSFSGKIFFEDYARALKEVGSHFYAGDADPIERPRPRKATWRAPATRAGWGWVWSNTDSARSEQADQSDSPVSETPP